MKRMKLLKSAALVLLSLSILCGSALAADWTQFLGGNGQNGVTDASTPRNAEELTLRWERRTGSAEAHPEIMSGWTDMPGMPVTVGDYVYYYSSQRLHKLRLSDGVEEKSAAVYGAPVNQFFINIAYGEGKIFVPCQQDNLDDGVELSGCFLRVFDAETLEQLYVTEKISDGQMQSPVIYGEGYFVTGTYYKIGAYACFTAEDEDPTRTDEVKKAKWIIPCDNKRVITFNGAAIYNGYCYYTAADSLYCVSCESGESHTVKLGEGYESHTTVVYNKETGRVFAASNHPERGAAVCSYKLDGSGIPLEKTRLEWISDTKGGGTQSSPVIYNGRLYIGGGGSTMGSAEPFHVIDAATMKEIYSVPITTKGSATVSTAYADKSNGNTVYIYLVPYAPSKDNASQLWILTDSEGQREAKYTVIEGAGRAQYCSQSVSVASDGSLLWYNDAGYLYCYKNSAMDSSFTDCQTHWARTYIEKLVKMGFVNGVGDGLFLPEGRMTRAEFAQVLAKLSGSDLKSAEGNAYSDVGADDWFFPAVSWAAANGIAEAAATFRPNDYISRAEIAGFMYRYVKNMGKPLPSVCAPLNFKDISGENAETKSAVSMLQLAGIINGKTDGGTLCFAPQDNATRAEAATMLVRFCDALKNA